ncbi:hybrid sensor histidine kinase/response regulator [Frigidibacter sp. MR17.24]|uniref:hybrid sensor histidine kinase/response regulator n=1 Tax=Frigidibacter sp. MR17.24 TaxID=3127345 RepID=UPI003012B174
MIEAARKFDPVSRPQRPVMRLAASLSQRSLWLLPLAVLASSIALAHWDRPAGLIGAAVACGLAGVFFVMRVIAGRQGLVLDQRLAQIAELVADDLTPSFVTDAGGRVLLQNRAASERYGLRREDGLVIALSELLASPATVVQRLGAKADRAGTAQEDIAITRGRVRLSVRRIDDDSHLWRLEERVTPGADPRGTGDRLPMLAVSRSGTVLYMNEALRRITGPAPRSLSALIGPAPVVSGAERRLVLAEGGTLRVCLAEIEGAAGRREIYVLPAPARDEADPTGFDTLPVAMLRLSVDGRIERMNTAARAMLGKVEPGTGLAQLLEGLGRPISDWIEDTVGGRIDRRPEVLRLRRPGAEEFLQVTLCRAAGGSGEGGLSLIAILADATQLKTLEAQISQSQKMQAIGQLAGGVAHDFNNLLTAIGGHCDLLKLRHDRGDPDFADLEQISQNANRAAALVSQLLAFSRKQTLHPQVLDLRELVVDLTHLLNRLVGEKVRLQLMQVPDLLPIRADPRQLEQVIVNLVVNARDAMPDGGTVRIETANTQLTQPVTRDRAEVPRGPYVVIRIIDSGTGIPPEHLSKIFEPFYTTKRGAEGTGLGLSTAYGIVKQSSGYLFVDSVMGQGSVFEIWLPALPAGTRDIAEPAPIAPPRRAQRMGQGTVLLVEDETPVRAFASRALRLKGYDVIEADCGEAALEILADRDLGIDLFVSDVIMPGLDGPAWVERALGARPQVPVIFMSGYAEDALEDRDARIGSAAFLQKPFSLADLTAIVEREIA